MAGDQRGRFACGLPECQRGRVVAAFAPGRLASSDGRFEPQTPTTTVDEPVGNREKRVGRRLSPVRVDLGGPSIHRSSPSATDGDSRFSTCPQPLLLLLIRSSNYKDREWVPTEGLAS
jgi:hypothetical protein